MRDHKFPQDIIGQLRKEIRDLHTSVRRLQSAQVTTLPIYDQAGYFTSDAVEGQAVVDTTGTNPRLSFRQNNAWHSIGTPDQALSGYAQYDTGAVSVANLTTFDFDFITKTADVNGWFDNPLVLSSHNVTCVVPGIYSCIGLIQFNGTPDVTKFMHLESFNDGLGSGFAFTQPMYEFGSAPTLKGSFTSYFSVGDRLRLRMRHNFGSTQSFTGEVFIQKITTAEIG